MGRACDLSLMASNATDATMFEEEGTAVSITRLRRELAAVDIPDEDDENRSAELLAAVLDAAFPDEEFAFDDEVVKQSLDELLLLLVALRDGGTHGKGLMEDLAAVFDSRLSPGTVYPRLHELEEADLLEMHELVRTKEYRIDDRAAARERIRGAMRQHLTLGLFLQAALEDL